MVIPSAAGLAARPALILTPVHNVTQDFSFLLLIVLPVSLVVKLVPQQLSAPSVFLVTTWPTRIVQHALETVVHVMLEMPHSVLHAKEDSTW